MNQIFTPAKVVIYQNTHSSDLAGFLGARPAIYPPFRQV